MLLEFVVEIVEEQPLHGYLPVIQQPDDFVSVSHRVGRDRIGASVYFADRVPVVRSQILELQG